MCGNAEGVHGQRKLGIPVLELRRAQTPASV